MSEERFDRIDQWQARADERFDGIDRWQSRADTRFDQIDQWQSRVDARFDGIDQRFDRVEGRLDHLQDGQRELTAEVRRLDGRVEELHQHMGVLHEDVLGRIAATGEFRGPTKREMDEGFATLGEAIGRRLDPIEAAIRDHGRRMDALEKGRP